MFNIRAAPVTLQLVNISGVSKTIANPGAVATGAPPAWAQIMRLDDPIPLSPNRAYVGADTRPCTNFYVVDLNTNQYLYPFPVPTGAYTSYITFAPNGQKCYICRREDLAITVINPVLEMSSYVIDVSPILPYAMVITPDGTKGYITDSSINLVKVMDMATETFIGTIAVGLECYDLACTLDGSKVYVTNYSSDDVSVISTATDTVIATITTSGGPFPIIAHPNGTIMYVANYDIGNVSVIDVATDTITATISTGGIGGDCFMGITQDGAKLYVPSETSPYPVVIIDTVAQTAIATLTTTQAPRSVGISPDGTKAFVTVRYASTLRIIDVATNAFIGTVPLLQGEPLFVVPVIPPQ